MRIVVCDANIFIDLLQVDLLPAYLNLGYKNHAPPGVIEEVKEQNCQMLIDAVETGQILIPTIENLNEISKLKNKYSSLSFQDSTCLFLAIKLNAMLLTGEKLLRRIAEEEYDLEVHGTLFIFDELLEDECITFRMAYEKLTRLITYGTYLPSNECQKRLRRWKRRF
jgi:predicted nucleic acid-binding protein